MTYQPRFTIDPNVTVVGDEVLRTAWVTVDLGQTFTPLHGQAQSSYGLALALPASSTPARPAQARQMVRGSASGGPLEPFRKRSPRVPPSSIVLVGRGRIPRLPVLGPPARPISANDNPMPDRPVPAGKRRSLARQMFFLAILMATIAGAYLNGRQHGFQKVILVPEPLSLDSEIT